MRHASTRFAGWASVSVVLATTVLAGAVPCGAQEVGRLAAERLTVEPLRFDPPEPQVHRLAGGVTVYLLEDRTLPLVDVMARFEGGYSHFGRDHYAAGMALPSLLRSGGTRALAPDSVDTALEYYAIQTTFGGSGESVFSGLNTLTENLDIALGLWGRLLKRPGFDTSRVEVWRGRELESVRRRVDDPGRLAFSEFNRLMFGDHPIGWELEPADLEPAGLSTERLRWLHRRVICPDRLVLGVTGDVSWEEMRPRLEALLADWEPCPEALPEAPAPSIRAEGGVFLIPLEVEQSTVVMAHATELRQEDARAYFASRVGNAILGASGFTSRLVSRVRTERGYAYAASSLWTAPTRYGGIIGATTRTRPETTVAAIRLVREVMEGMTTAAPALDEVTAAVDEATNGFVFNFESAAQIISRRMAYEVAGLPSDWLVRYLRGLQSVRPEDVREVFTRHLDVSRLTILVVGDPAGFAEALDTLGPVTILEPGATGPSGPSGSPRSRR